MGHCKPFPITLHSHPAIVIHTCDKHLVVSPINMILTILSVVTIFFCIRARACDVHLFDTSSMDSVHAHGDGLAAAINRTIIEHWSMQVFTCVANRLYFCMARWVNGVNLRVSFTNDLIIMYNDSATHRPTPFT